MRRSHFLFSLICLFIGSLIVNGCVSDSDRNEGQTIPILSWVGIPPDKADILFPLAKECGFDWYLGLYSSMETAVSVMDAAARAGIGIIPGFPEMRDSTEKAVAAIKDHPALIAYHLKDEPEVWDVDWLRDLHDKVQALDPEHPCYINHYPNWAWNVEKYADNIELYASEIDTQFYSFDQYPVTEKDGSIVVRPAWYRNLEEFSAMARRHGKPFWAFALAASHHLGAPSPPAFYPVPTLGHLRLQVFSNLLYGAQVIQYFTFQGVVNGTTCEKRPEYDLFRQVNSEIKAYSPVFLECKVLDVWHIGEAIPNHTKRLDEMPHRKLRSISVDGEGAVVSLIEKAGKKFLAIQNRDCVNEAELHVKFKGSVRRFTVNGLEKFSSNQLMLPPGDVVIFRL